MRCFRCKFALLAGLAMCAAAAEAVAQSPGLLAQGPGPESYASWVIRCLGIFGLSTVLAGVAIFIGACLVVCLAHRPAVIAAYLVFLLLPLLLGALGAFGGASLRLQSLQYPAPSLSNRKSSPACQNPCCFF